jgi:hypothetical protein
VAHERAVVGDDGRESGHQLTAFGTFTAVEADGLGRIRQPD